MAKPRVKVPKTAKAGEIIKIKTLIAHKMETGNRKNKKTGKLIPRKIIQDFQAKFNGKEVFRANLHPGISANPYLAFHAKVDKSGEFEFTWTEDTGKKWSAKKSITVG